jgi:arginyl-tRNA synthetase
MDFDLDLAKKQSTDNPVYYVQYAHARISSIMRKAEGTMEKPDLSLMGEDEKRLIRMLYRFEAAINQAVKDLDPTRIATYLMDLAGEYQSYYQKGDKDREYRVLSEDENLRAMRLHCSLAVQRILRQGLSLLSISAPESM